MTSTPPLPASDPAGAGTEWMRRAACAERLHACSSPARLESAHDALAVCERCPVHVECLMFALRNGIREGVWGGMRARARRVTI